MFTAELDGETDLIIYLFYCLIQVIIDQKKKKTKQFIVLAKTLKSID